MKFDIKSTKRKSTKKLNWKNINLWLLSVYLWSNNIFLLVNGKIYIQTNYGENGVISETVNTNATNTVSNVETLSTNSNKNKSNINSELPFVLWNTEISEKYKDIKKPNENSIFLVKNENEKNNIQIKSNLIVLPIQAIKRFNQTTSLATNKISNKHNKDYNSMDYSAKIIQKNNTSINIVTNNNNTMDLIFNLNSKNMLRNTNIEEIITFGSQLSSVTNDQHKQIYSVKNFRLVKSKPVKRNYKNTFINHTNFMPKWSIINDDLSLNGMSVKNKRNKVNTTKYLSDYNNLSNVDQTLTVWSSIKLESNETNESNNKSVNDHLNQLTTINYTNHLVSYQNRNVNHSEDYLTKNRNRINNVFERARDPLQFSNKTSVKLRNRFKQSGKVSLLGLFELTTRWGERPEGQSELAAAQMAVRHINRRGLLPGYTLELITNDTQSDPGVGVDRFFHALYTQNSTRMVMLLGTGSSEVTESLAKIVPYWNIVQVSFGSTAPALSDRREFPLFYRTVAPDSAHNPARIAFIRRFGWDTVTTFSQNEEVHSLAVNDLVTELESANISCAATITFGETDFKDQLRMLRDLDTRIIIGSFSHEVAPKIFCEAFKLGMYGADYAWILQETLGSQSWWEPSKLTECSQQNLNTAIENVLIVTSHNNIVGGENSFSGLTNTKFEEELQQSLNVPMPPLSRYAPQTYDAVWSIALALRGAEDVWRNEFKLNKTKKRVKLDFFDYTRYDMANEFLNQFSRLNFLGVSGRVKFSGSDRICTTAFYQIQLGNLKPVAIFSPETEFLDFTCPQCVTIKWQSGQIPIAKRVFKMRIDTISTRAFFTITSLAILGIILALSFLAFNLHFRKLKTIKLSSPKLSNITAVGCILVYAAVILLGLDYSTLPSTDTAFPTVCTARVCLLSAGFSLAFGSMFAKTYRVHRIFTHSWSGICKDKMLKDTKLISLVGALLLLDGLVVTFWVITDPMERHLSNLTLEISTSDRSVVYQPQVEVCRSLHTKSWLGILYAYKGLLLVVGVYMAWETRHVKIPALNDSQYIGISVYGAVITSASVVVLANLLSERVTLAFIIITSIILTSTTATLCLVFLPKMNDIWNKGDNDDAVIHSMGLKLEYNTRRFLTDDRRELQYRVEVQNRVYRKEMATLDAEIAKLEKMLENRSSSTSSSQTSMLHHLKPEIIIDDDSDVSMQRTQQQRLSITGGLPLLLLSVLPPVIPRASWPSAQHMQIPMRRSVTFSSQPHMEDSADGVRFPAIDLLNLRLTHQQNSDKTGFLNKIRALFGVSRAPSRKTSTSSIAPSHIANALKAHMGMLTGLLPNSSTSCQVLNTNQNEAQTLRKSSFARSGNAINSTHIEIVEPELVCSRNRRKSIAFTISASIDNQSNIQTHEVDIEPEPRVNFVIPVRRRSSIVHQNSQPTLRERVKGSPRFPHRIVPTSSLNALEDSYKVKSCNGSNEQISSSKWKSMEEETFIVSNNKLTYNTNPLNVDTLPIESIKSIEPINEEEIVPAAPNNFNHDSYGIV